MTIIRSVIRIQTGQRERCRSVICRFRAHPEKCETVFGQDARQTRVFERRSDSIKSKRALMCGFAALADDTQYGIALFNLRHMSAF